MTRTRPWIDWRYNKRRLSIFSVSYVARFLSFSLTNFNIPMTSNRQILVDVYFSECIYDRNNI